MVASDGRNSWMLLAKGCSPAHSMDQKRPSAVLKSVSKLAAEEVQGGVLLNQKMNPQTLTKEEDQQKLLLI